jgi:hypothetical protein
MIQKGHPNEFIRIHVPSKKECDAVMDLHPNFLYCCIPRGINEAETNEFAEFLTEVLYNGSEDTPQFHARNIEKHVAAGPCRQGRQELAASC